MSSSSLERQKGVAKELKQVEIEQKISEIQTRWSQLLNRSFKIP